MEDSTVDYSATKHLIAYFSMEIALTENIPTYSGGLGVLAGDSIKSFADLNLDVVGVTLLSEKGYFNQDFDERNYQKEVPVNWNKEKYLKKLDVQTSVNINGRNIEVTAWEYYLIGHMGKPVRIIYLDTNLPQNSETDRNLTSYLYGGDVNYRLEQEIILGVGGLKILRELDIAPKKYHMNEGHAAFLTLQIMQELKEEVPSFQERYKIVKDLCSFTTHTPIPAGHDAFDEVVVQNYLGDLFPKELRNYICVGGKFSMTLLALQFSSYTNAVSRKHRNVSLKMFPNYAIDYITNGVHSSTWIHPILASLLDKYIVDWRSNPGELRNCHKIPLQELNLAHRKCKNDLINLIKEKNGIDLDPHVFTIGFARRATSYKRAELLFKDFERLKNMADKIGKIQIIFAGKAHPRDSQGKEIIQRIKGLTYHGTNNLRIVFINNYDMGVAKKLLAGVDLWLNTPKRPLEASGTSGMKAAHNAVPSLSILDGWWIEGCIENMTGWAIGKENVYGDDFRIDEEDASSLYEKLEQKIIPLYYNDNEGYLNVMRNTLSINASYFNTHRMAKQYIIRAYVRRNKLT